MDLNIKNIEGLIDLADIGPEYDVEKLRQDTKDNPKWLAFGTGNIFRQYIGSINQELINKGLYDSGIIVASSRSPRDIDEIYRPHDNLALAVTMDSSGGLETELLANFAESLDLTRDFDRLKEIATNPDLQIISYIITEKGYSITDSNGELLDYIKSDIDGEPKDAKSLLAKSVYMLYERYKNGKSPVTMLSMDNVSDNGDVLKNGIFTIAQAWVDKGYMDNGFIAYLENEDKISFPITMIDKITPGPEAEVTDYLKDQGFDVDIKEKDGRIMSPFTNAEETGYLAIEDIFANGRPPFEDVGVYMTDRETVKNIETMKVTTCLNPLHTALAVFGSLLGHDRIYKCMEDEELVALVRGIGYDEGLPVVKDPGIINPKEFIDEVIDVRFPNPYIPDMPQRIATDTSLKVGVRFGETIKAYRDAADRDPKDLKLIPLVLAGWIRYLMGLDDNLEEIEISPDPRLEELQELLKNNEIGRIDEEAVRRLLTNEVIFGENLVELGLDDKIINYLKELSAGKGAIRETLKKYLD